MALATEQGNIFPGIQETWRPYVNSAALPAIEVLRRAYGEDINERGERVPLLAACVDENGKFTTTPFWRDTNRTDEAIGEVAPEINQISIDLGTSHMTFRNDPNVESFGHIDDDGTMFGQVFHEYRRLKPDSPEQFKVIHAALRKQGWGQPDSPDIVKYCGAADVTPDYISSVCKAFQRNPNILQREIYNDDLHRYITIGDGVQAAVNLITDLVVHGPDGKQSVDDTNRDYLLEWQRRNPEGLRFQNITDGYLSTMHMDEDELQGMLGNYHQPVTHLEVQLGVIRAFKNAAILYPEKAKEYLDLAEKVRSSTLKRFWMPEKKYFAAAIDHDEMTGDYRQVKTLSLMGASVLNSDIFDSMPEYEKRQYIEPIVKTILSPQFMTDIGPLVKAKQYAHVVRDPDNPMINTAEYQGSHHVWPVLVFDCIQGLHRQGFHNTAVQLENRLLNLVHSNSNVEYGYVGNGTVYTTDGKKINIDGVIAQNYKRRKEFDALSPEEQAGLLRGKTRIDLVTTYTQGDQLFTAAPILAIKHAREIGKFPDTTPGSWQEKIEHEVITSPNWKNIEVLDGDELHQFADNEYFFIIDEDKYPDIERRIIERSERIRQQRTGRRVIAA
jgi:hypothetical protein